MTLLLHFSLLTSPHQDPTPSAIEWRYDLSAALADAQRTNTPVIACFVAGWCHVCRRFQGETLTSRAVNELGGRAIWVLLEIDRNISLARAYRIRATPTVDLIDPKGVTRTRITGYLSPEALRKSVDEFIKEIVTTPDVHRDKSPREVRGEDMTGLTETPQGYRGTGICFSHVGFGPLRALHPEVGQLQF